MNAPSISNFKIIKKLPKRIIYQSQVSPDTYKMFSTKTGKLEGMMIARPELVEDAGIYPKKKKFWAYYVVGLHAQVKEQGVGKTFCNFLKNLANNDKKCQGRIWLRAFNNMETNGRASSTWWYKQGFIGCDKKAQSDLERVLHRQKPKYGDWYMDMDMYLPEKK